MLVINIWKNVKLRIQYTELFEVDCFLVLILKQAGLSVNICAKAAIKLDLKTKLVIRFH